MSSVSPTVLTVQRATSLVAAVACFLVAIQLDGVRRDEHTLRRANTAALEGRFDDARRLAAQLTDGRTAADAWSVRAGIAVFRGRLTAAATAYRRVIALRPNDWRARHDLAAVLLLNGQDDRAFREYSRAAELNPGLPALGNFGTP